VGKFQQLAFCVAWALLFGAALGIPVVGQAQNGVPSNGPIRVTTKEVTVPVTVTDRHGEAVLDLSQNDFHVFDDGIEQQIDHWELGGNPLAVAVVIETSSRLQAMMPVIHGMGAVFTQTVMALDGEAAVITYDSTADVRESFTSDQDAVEKAIKETKFEVPQMSLYDGMATAVRLLSQQPTRWRRIMLVIGESQDTGSSATLSQVVRDAERADIAIYAVGASSSAIDLRSTGKGVTPLKLRHLPPITTTQCIDVRGNPCLDLATPALWLLERGTNEIRHHQLEVAADATGGVVYSALRESALVTALDQIGGDLHAQYILGYRPQAAAPIGFHTIRVSVSRPGVVIRARPGYFLTDSLASN
jgi:VWFA-related protein